MLSLRFLTGNAIGAAGVALLSGCMPGQDKTPDQPNILWIFLDDARADVAGCYGSPWANTPNIDRLAEEGVRFHNAIIQNPVCVPSRKSMKTGYYAYEAGPVAMGRVPEVEGDYIDHRRMEEISQAPSLLNYWTEAGMKPVNIGKVHAFHDRWDLRGDAPRLFTVHGNPTGFFNDSLSYHPSILDAERVFTDTHGWQIGGIIDVRPEDTETWRLGDMAVKLIDELAAGGNPFFLRVSFHAPHVACYVPPEYFTDPSLIDLPVPGEDELADKPRFERGPLKTYAGASLTHEQIDLARGTYYGMVALVDVQVGRIIKALEDTGQLENTIIAFTSDQGFQLGEHGLWKKRVFYDGNVRVPLIFRYPGKLPQGVTIDEPVEMTDFLPTLMEISGFTVPADIRGASLLPLISGEVKEWREACFSEIDHSQSMYDELRQGTGRRVMVRTSDWKLVFFMDSRVEDSDGALYNLAADPYERHNLYNDPAYGEVIGYLEKLAQEWTNGRNFAPVLKD